MKPKESIRKSRGLATANNDSEGRGPGAIAGLRPGCHGRRAGVGCGLRATTTGIFAHFAELLTVCLRPRRKRPRARKAACGPEDVVAIVQRWTFCPASVTDRWLVLGPRGRGRGCGRRGGLAWGTPD